MNGWTRLWAASLLVLSAAEPAEAQYVPGYHDFVVAESAGALSQAQVSVAFNQLAVVAWRDGLGQIWTCALDHHVLSNPVPHGSGHDPALSFIPNGCYLAFANGSSITMVQGDGLAWGTPMVFETGNGLATSNPDFGTYDYGIDEAKDRRNDSATMDLVWEEGTRIYLARETSSAGWGAPALVCSDGAGNGWSQPEVERSYAGGQVFLPRVYYRTDQLPMIGYREFDGSAWSARISPPEFEPFGAEYDVAIQPDFRHAVLGLGIPRPCLCNDIGYVEETAGGGWTPWQNLTVIRDRYNLPAYPSISGSTNGQVHAFWQESFYDQTMQPSGEAMFAENRGDGVWTPQPSDFFTGHVGKWTDVSGDPLGQWPSYVWIETTTAGGSKLILRHPDSSGGDVAQADPPLLRGVRAWPNPFLVSTRLFFEGSPARGWGTVEVLDLQGRLVRRLSTPAASCEANQFQVSWDGRDGTGLGVPAGIYCLRAGDNPPRLGTVVRLR